MRKEMQSSIVSVRAAHDTLDAMGDSRNRGSNNKAIFLRYRRQPVETTHARLRPMDERTPCELRATLSQL